MSAGSRQQPGGDGAERRAAGQPRPPPASERSPSLRRAAHQLLSREECAAFKAALRAFRETTTAEQLVDSLAPVIDSPKKLGLLRDIALLLPARQRVDFVRLAKRRFPGSERLLPSERRPGDDGDGDDDVEGDGLSAASSAAAESEKITLAESGPVRRLKGEAERPRIIKLNSATFQVRYRSRLSSTSSTSQSASSASAVSVSASNSSQELPRHHLQQQQQQQQQEQQQQQQQVSQNSVRARAASVAGFYNRRGSSAVAGVFGGPQDKGFWALNSPRRGLQELRRQERLQSIGAEASASAGSVTAKVPNGSTHSLATPVSRPGVSFMLSDDAGRYRVPPPGRASTPNSPLVRSSVAGGRLQQQQQQQQVRPRAYSVLTSDASPGIRKRQQEENLLIDFVNASSEKDHKKESGTHLAKAPILSDSNSEDEARTKKQAFKETPQTDAIGKKPASDEAPQTYRKGQKQSSEETPLTDRKDNKPPSEETPQTERKDKKSASDETPQTDWKGHKPATEEIPRTERKGHKPPSNERSQTDKKGHKTVSEEAPQTDRKGKRTASDETPQNDKKSHKTDSVQTLQTERKHHKIIFGETSRTNRKDHERASEETFEADRKCKKLSEETPQTNKKAQKPAPKEIHRTKETAESMSSEETQQFRSKARQSASKDACQRSRADEASLEVQTTLILERVTQSEPQDRASKSMLPEAAPEYAQNAQPNMHHGPVTNSVANEKPSKLSAKKSSAQDGTLKKSQTNDEQRRSSSSSRRRHRDGGSGWTQTEPPAQLETAACQTEETQAIADSAVPITRNCDFRRQVAASSDYSGCNSDFDRKQLNSGSRQDSLAQARQQPAETQISLDAESAATGLLASYRCRHRSAEPEASAPDAFRAPFCGQHSPPGAPVVSQSASMPADLVMQWLAGHMMAQAAAAAAAAAATAAATAAAQQQLQQKRQESWRQVTLKRDSDCQKLSHQQKQSQQQHLFGISVARGWPRAAAESAPPSSTVLVSSVVTGSQAHQLGIQPGDEILEVDGAPVDTMTLQQLAEAISQQETVSLIIRTRSQNQSGTTEH